MTALSLHAYAYCAERYALLTTGASVGEGYGPVVVARQDFPLSPFDTPAVRPEPFGFAQGRLVEGQQPAAQGERKKPGFARVAEKLRKKPVAVPGRLTTACLLLRLALGPVRLKFLPFDEIPEAVRTGRAAAGVLIHEGQITYAGEGLRKVLDLGEWWQKETGLPVPLGVNAVRRDLGPERRKLLATLLKQSLDYALAHRAEALAYARQYGRGLDDAGTARFVGMYVNRWAADCRPDAARAMQLLLDRGAEAGLIPSRVTVEFVEGSC